jgi:hypothetical protein
MTSGEKGETISVIACCNAEGSFIPPTCILKWKNKNPEWEDALPNGSKVIMNEKSGYVNSDIFMQWLKEQFIPRKQSGRVVLLLDGHTSQCTDPDMLELAEENGIIMVCLPPHSTHYLQPLDRCFFKPLKHFFYKAIRVWAQSQKYREHSLLLSSSRRGRNLQLNLMPILDLKLVEYIHIIQKKYQRKPSRYLMLFCLHQLMKVMGQTSTKTQNAVLPQELNQEDLQRHYRQKINLKQDHLLRTLPLSLF